MTMLMWIIFVLYVQGLVATGEKPQKQTGGLVVTKDLMGEILLDTLVWQTIKCVAGEREIWKVNLFDEPNRKLRFRHP